MISTWKKIIPHVPGDPECFSLDATLGSPITIDVNDKNDKKRSFSVEMYTMGETAVHHVGTVRSTKGVIYQRLCISREFTTLRVRVVPSLPNVTVIVGVEETPE